MGKGSIEKRIGFRLIAEFNRVTTIRTQNDVYHGWCVCDKAKVYISLTSANQRKKTHYAKHCPRHVITSDVSTPPYHSYYCLCILPSLLHLLQCHYTMACLQANALYLKGMCMGELELLLCPKSADEKRMWLEKLQRAG